MNKKGITYSELTDFMRRSFQKRQETNFYLAAKHFFDTVTNAQPTRSLVEMTKITDAVKSLTTSFFKRTAGQSNKSAQDMCNDILLHAALACAGGHLLTKEVLDKIQADTWPNELIVRCSEWARAKHETSDTALTIRPYRPRERANDSGSGPEPRRTESAPAAARSQSRAGVWQPPHQRRGSPFPPSEQFRRTQNKVEYGSVVCFRCGARGHKYNDCFKRRVYCTYCRNNSHDLLACKRKLGGNGNTPFFRSFSRW